MGYVIEYHYASHVGRYRRTNQDNFFCNGAWMDWENKGTEGVHSGCVSVKDKPVFAVFDGMGGEERGEMAAYIATKKMAGFSFQNQDLFDFCEQANRDICQFAEDNMVSSMGTTAAILRFTPRDCWLCNIGDSKVYVIEQAGLQQISCDHVGIAAFGRKPPLSQNLGIPETEMIIEPYVAQGSYQEGSAFLICSDGITDMLTELQIQQILGRHSGREAAEKLLEGALANGGKDNITLILLYAKKEKKTLWDFLKR